MSTIKLQIQLFSEDLLKAVEQLSQEDLKIFISQVISLQARRHTSGLNQRESELLFLINQVIPVETENRYDDLISKRDMETLTNDEHKELLCLTEQIEIQQAQRVQHLVELANLRKISLNTLMENLNIQTPSYV